MRIKKYRSRYSTLNELARDIYVIENNEPTFTVTLASNTTVTTVANQFVGTGSVVVMMPTTVDAGAEGYYITTGKESFTITHSSGASTRIYTYFIYG